MTNQEGKQFISGMIDAVERELHNGKAIHRAYAKKAEIIVPSLELRNEGGTGGMA